jgi:hypothetical protein
MVTVDGFILDKSQNPVENATVVIAMTGLFALSDENGYFIMTEVPPGIYTVYAIQRYYAKFEADVNLSENMTVTINLDRA